MASHILLLTVFAFFISLVFAVIAKDDWHEQLRFGGMMFRPRCPSCRACQTLRVKVAQFAPDRSQRRAWMANCGEIEIRIGPPSVTRAKLTMYDRKHVYAAQFGALCSMQLYYNRDLFKKVFGAPLELHVVKPGAAAEHIDVIANRAGG